MIISRKKFEQELANARSEVLRQNDLAMRFRDMWSRTDETNRRLSELEYRFAKLYAELHPEQKTEHPDTNITCCGR